MSIKMIKLTEADPNRPIMINVEHISAMWKHSTISNTAILLIGQKYPIYVKESLDSIMKTRKEIRNG